jgi:cellulose biosynthesis protein BcsQ
MIKLGFYNHKGGCSKTTAVINITYVLQKIGKKVLVVDCDSQMNCFSFFQSGKNQITFQPSKYENVFNATWNTYKNSDEAKDFDYVLFDMPPAMTDEVKEIIRHCDAVFVPIILGYFEIAGLADVTAEIQKQGAKLGGVFAAMFNPQNNDAEAFDELRTILKGRLLNTVIPWSKTVRESQKSEVSIEELFIRNGVPPNKNSWKIVRAYEDLTREIMERSQ